MPTRNSVTTTLAMLALAATAASFAAEAPEPMATLIKELRLQEDTVPVRERVGWRRPKKMVVLGDAQSYALIAPGVEVVGVKDVASAAEAAKDADIVAGLTSYPGICEPEILDSAKELRWIFSLSAGVERCMAVPSVLSRNLLVTNMRGVESATIAEHAVAMALALARGFDTFLASQAKAQWNRGAAAETRMQTLKDKTLLVVGLGGIGTEVASRAHALGMKVVATRASSRTGPEFVSYVGLSNELLTLAKTADVIVNAAPLTKETTGIFDAEFFRALKPTAFFINVARGQSVVTEDLVAALNEGRIAGAGLDVTDPEPLPPDHPLWRAPNVIITPHVSSNSDLPRSQRTLLARENLRRYVAGERMLSVVDLRKEY